MKRDVCRNWTCSDIDTLLDRYLRERSPLSEQARQHLDLCSRCRELHAFMTSGQENAEPAPELIAKIRTALAADLRPVSPLPHSRVLAARILAVGSAVVLAVCIMYGPGGIAVMTSVQTVAAAFLFAGFAILLAAALSRLSVPGSARDIPAHPALIVAFLSAYASFVALLFSWNLPLTVSASDWRCTERGLTVATVASVMLILLLRRAAIHQPATFGATLGGTSGLVATAALQLSCFHREGAHLLVWHGAVPALAAAAGLAGGLIWRRWSEQQLS